MENFRFGMTKVYSEIPPPHFGKLQIWDDQSLLRNTPPLWKTSDLGWPKFTPKYPPPYGKLQIWDDQSLLRNTPPPPLWKTSDLGWPKFTPKYPPPPIMENFRFGMTKVYSEIPPPPPTNQKLSESSSLRFSEYRELLHVETLSNPDKLLVCLVNVNSYWHAHPDHYCLSASQYLKTDNTKSSGASSSCSCFGHFLVITNQVDPSLYSKRT